jgi:hypothetical protein
LADEHYAWQGRDLIRGGKDLISFVTRARVPMPKSTREWKERCDHYRASVDREHAANLPPVARTRAPAPPAATTSSLSSSPASSSPSSLRAGESDVSSARVAAANPPR